MSRKLSIVSSDLREPPSPVSVDVGAAGSSPAAQVPTSLSPRLEAPEDLDEPHRREWDRIVSVAPHLEEADRHALTVLIDAILLHRDAAANVRKIGTLIKSTKGVPMQNPYLPVMNKQAALISRYSKDLGLSPAERSRGRGKGKAQKSFGAFAKLKDRTAF